MGLFDSIGAGFGNILSTVVKDVEEGFEGIAGDVEQAASEVVSDVTSGNFGEILGDLEGGASQVVGDFESAAGEVVSDAVSGGSALVGDTFSALLGDRLNGLLDTSTDEVSAEATDGTDAAGADTSLSDFQLPDFSASAEPTEEDAPAEAAEASSEDDLMAQIRGGLATQGAGPAAAASGDGSALEGVINRLDPEHNRKYLPHGGNTYCNVFAMDVMKEMDVPFPGHGGVAATNANGLYSWLNRSGSANGWRLASADEAQDIVNRGGAAVAVWRNPSGGHGHIGVIRPGEVTASGPAMAQAGSTNFADRHLRNGFGASKTPQIWVHE